MNATVDEKKMKEVIDGELKNAFNNSSNSIDKINLIDKEIKRIYLIDKEDKLLKGNYLEGKSIDELRDIQCLVNEAKIIEKNTEISDIYKGSKDLFKAIDEIIEKIKFFRKDCKTRIPQEVIDTLHEILNSRKDKINIFYEKLEFIEKMINPLSNNSNIPSLNTDSNKAALKIWAEKIELFAEGIEECLDTIPELPLGMIEDIGIGLLSVTQNVNYTNGQKESFRRRIKYAATFILNLAKKARLKSLKENSAEAKAIKRIEAIEQIDNQEAQEWITYLEEGESINMEELNNLL